MATEVSHRLDWVYLTLDFNFERLHGLLDGSSDFIESCVNTCLTETCVCCFLDSQKKVIIGRVKGHSESTIN